MKTVKEIMNFVSQKSNSINKEARAIDALVLMENEDIDYTVILEESECVGIVSEVDYMNKIILARNDPNQTKVKDIMTNSICSVDVKAPLHRCLELMNTFKIRHLLVFDEFLYKGVITLHDLMLAALDENIDKLMERDQREYFLGSYI
jgi:CBS domain-containing protein